MSASANVIRKSFSDLATTNGTGSKILTIIEWHRTDIIGNVIIAIGTGIETDEMIREGEFFFCYLNAKFWLIHLEDVDGVVSLWSVIVGRFC